MEEGGEGGGDGEEGEGGRGRRGREEGEGRREEGGKGEKFESADTQANEYMSSLIPRHHAQPSIFGSTSDVSWLRA